MKKKIALFCSILAITVMAAACGNSSTEKNTGTNAGGSETTSVSGETGTQTGTEQKDTTDAQTNTSAGDTNTAPQTSSDANDESIKDSDGESQARGSVMLPYSEAAQEQSGLPAEFTLDDMPERLIVMTMGPTEILHALGVSMLAVPDIIDESQEWAQDLDAQRLPFTAKTMDTESIVALKPDMIIMSAGKKEAYGDFLESQGIPVYYTVSTSMDGGTIDSVKAEVSMYGEGFGRTEELAALMDRFDDLEASTSAHGSRNMRIWPDKN